MPVTAGMLLMLALLFVNPCQRHGWDHRTQSCEDEIQGQQQPCCSGNRRTHAIQGSATL